MLYLFPHINEYCDIFLQMLLHLLLENVPQGAVLSLSGVCQKLLQKTIWKKYLSTMVPSLVYGRVRRRILPMSGLKKRRP